MTFRVESPQPFSDLMWLTPPAIFAALTQEGAVQTWSGAELKRLPSVSAEEETSVPVTAISTYDGEHLAVGSKEGDLRIENLHADMSMQTLKFPSRPGTTPSVSVLASTGKPHLFAASKGQLAYSNLDTHRIQIIGETDLPIQEIHPHADQHAMLLTSKGIELWAQKETHWQGSSCLVIPSDTSLQLTSASLALPHVIVATDTGRIFLHDLQKQTSIQAIDAHTDVIHKITAMGSSTIASGSSDKTVKIWDLRTAKCQSTHMLRGRITCLLKGTNRLIAAITNPAPPYYLESIDLRKNQDPHYSQFA